MRWALELVDGPEIEPVTLAQLKRHLGEFEDVLDRDEDVTAAGVAAREFLEDWAGRVLIDQRWRLRFGDSYLVDTVTDYRAGLVVPTEERGTAIFLRRSPVIAVESVASVAADGTETDLAADSWALQDAAGLFPVIVARSGAFKPGRFSITFRAGMANRDLSPQEGAEVIPERWKTAVKLYAEALYHRDSATMEKLQAAAMFQIRGDRATFDFA